MMDGSLNSRWGGGWGSSLDHGDIVPEGTEVVVLIPNS